MVGSVSIHFGFQGRADALLQSDKDFAVRFEAQRDALRVEADEREKKLKDSFQKKIDAKNAELTQKEEEVCLVLWCLILFFVGWN